MVRDEVSRVALPEGKEAVREGEKADEEGGGEGGGGQKVRLLVVRMGDDKSSLGVYGHWN